MSGFFNVSAEGSSRVCHTHHQNCLLSIEEGRYKRMSGLRWLRTDQFFPGGEPFSVDHGRMPGMQRDRFAAKKKEELQKEEDIKQEAKKETNKKSKKDKR